MKAITQKTDGSPVPRLVAKEGESAGTDSEQKVNNFCPECHSPYLRFGSRDPCEGDFYWCKVCGCGPILFPLYHCMPTRCLVDADTLQAELEKTPFADTEPFDPARLVKDIVGS